MKKILSIIICMALLCLILDHQSNAKTVIYPTTADGIAVEENDECLIDYSNTGDGYIIIHYKKNYKKKIKVQVQGGSSKEYYTYDIKPLRNEVLPLTEGNGTYKITVNIQASGNSYYIVMSKNISVQLSNQFAPYVRPSQYINYNKKTKAVKKAASLTKKSKTDLDKVKKVYSFVIKYLKYDKKLAKNAPKGYLPDLNKVYKKKKGICFDYAAMMTAMLRSQGVPTKLIIGYTGNAYHAWINVYSKKKGWIAGAIYFNGKKWKLMDPTFASTGKSSKSIMKYIGNGKNYKKKYSY